MQYALKGATAILSQEHHSRDISWNDLRAHAANSGWKVAGAQAVAIPKGKTSAGVGIVVRTHIEAGLAGPTEDWSPAESPGRLTAMWVRIGPGAGVLLLSAPLWHNEVL